MIMALLNFMVQVGTFLSHGTMGMKERRGGCVGGELGWREDSYTTVALQFTHKRFALTIFLAAFVPRHHCRLYNDAFIEIPLSVYRYSAIYRLIKTINNIFDVDLLYHERHNTLEKV